MHTFFEGGPVFIVDAHIFEGDTCDSEQYAYRLRAAFGVEVVERVFVVLIVGHDRFQAGTGDCGFKPTSFVDDSSP